MLFTGWELCLDIFSLNGNNFSFSCLLNNFVDILDTQIVQALLLPNCCQRKESSDFAKSQSDCGIC